MIITDSKKVFLYIKKFSIGLKNKFKHKTVFLVLFGLFFAFFLFFPNTLFNDPYSKVILDSDSRLLSAHIAADEQWRFPETKNIPQKLEKCFLNFEDKRFYSHSGIDWLAFSRAVYQNVAAKRIVSGASTISMQVVRLSRKGKPRNVWQKLVEMYMAYRLEMTFSKNEILKLYLSHAPFGGNVVGVDAAAWRYFGMSTDKLSWAEAATLAVLPNSPALIHPGRNRNSLKKKRNKLLKILLENQVISNDDYQLALDEPIPQKPIAFPNLAPHLLVEAAKQNPDSGLIQTTIKSGLQKRMLRVVEKHHKGLKNNNINNIGLIVIEVQSGNILAYIGNTTNAEAQHVDVVQGWRSTGSVLKPFLYAAMLTSGNILPNALVYDIPTQIGGYSPENFNLGYDGAVPAKRALARSLNVPIVKMLQDYGVPRFHHVLQKVGLSSITEAPDHYGLSIVLGGCEGSLLEISTAYASMARSLNNFYRYNSQYDPANYCPANYFYQKGYTDSGRRSENALFSASALWYTFEAMLTVERPESRQNWQMFSSSRKVAWKTGTSFGFRDAWSVGVTPEYVVGVWVGNADGEGRHGLIGIKTAAPLLFDAIDLLPPAQKQWFDKPFDDMIRVGVCPQSGYLAGPNCESADTLLMPALAENSDVCPYHRLVHLSTDEHFRVNSGCAPINEMVHKKWFVLPPVVEWYYKKKNVSYKVLPSFREGCTSTKQTSAAMQLIYPHPDSRVYVPHEISGKKGRVVFEVAHRNPKTTIFWYLDEAFLGSTYELHQMELNPLAGRHLLVLIDENGEKLARYFEVLEKE